MEKKDNLEEKDKLEEYASEEEKSRAVPKTHPEANEKPANREGSLRLKKKKKNTSKKVHFKKPGLLSQKTRPVKTKEDTVALQRQVVSKEL